MKVLGKVSSAFTLFKVVKLGLLCKLYQIDTHRGKTFNLTVTFSELESFRV